MSGHTPGPWTVDDPGHKPGHTSTLRICGPAGKTILAMFDHGNARANARLIAVSPKMLIVLQALVSCDKNGRFGDPDFPAVVRQALAVIAEAEGEARS